MMGGDALLAIGLFVAALSVSLAATLVIYFSQAPTAVIRHDPPDGAGSPLIWNDTMADDKELMDEIGQENVLIVFWLALVHLNGWCLQNRLWQVVQEHNKQFENWPEYKHRIISYHFMVKALSTYELKSDKKRVIGVPIALCKYEAELNEGQAYIPHVIIETKAPSGMRSRLLISVWHLYEVAFKKVGLNLPELPPAVVTEVAPEVESEALPADVQPNSDGLVLSAG